MTETIFSDSAKDKTRRLLDYLTHLARLRYRVIYNIESYTNVLWLHEIPREEKLCFTQAWGPSEEHDSSIWIEISKPKEPILGEVPSKCKEWVNEATLYTSENPPELFSSINIREELPNPNITPDDTDQESLISFDKTLELSDYPEVSKAWDEFFDNIWFPWAEKHKRWQLVHNIYAKLFAIYQEQQKLGEEYELVLGIGLLTWLTPSGQSIKRHLLTARANLIFEPNLGKFTVTPSTDGAQLTIELDMLDVDNQPINAGQTAKESLISAYDNPWERDPIDYSLGVLANSFADQGQGEYHSDHLGPCHSKARPKPIVDYSPALILRKRSVRGLEQTLIDIRAQIEESNNIPPEFGDLCEIVRDKSEVPDFNQKALEQPDEPLFFPLPSNEHQREIANRLQSTTGVLVQGPPGTGKSHSIANLICHLLATDKRVLVTAKTPRALQVLHEKLPPQIQPLCISLLGSGLEEQRSLEASVSAILNKQDKWSDQGAEHQIKDLMAKFHQLQSERATLNHRVRSIREKETFQQSVIDGKYCGTAAKIALQLRAESDKLNWLPDSITADTVLPLSTDAMAEIHEVLSTITPESERELELTIPNINTQLPSSEIFNKLVYQESKATEQYLKGERSPESQFGKTIENANVDKLSHLVDTVLNLTAAVESMRKRPMPWIEKAVFDMLSDNDTPWKERLLVLSQKMDGLKDRARNIDTHSFLAPDSLDHNKILFNAESLKSHMDSGGKMGWGPFRPTVVRESLHTLKNVTIDGQSCNSSIALDKLIEHLTVHHIVDYLWSIWLNLVERKTGSLLLQVAELEELQEALAQVVALYDLLETSKQALSEIQGLEQPAWHDSSAINELRVACNAAISKHNLQEITDKLDRYLLEIQSFSNQPNSHPIAQKAVSIIRERQNEQYPTLLSDIEQLEEQSELVSGVRHNLDVLSRVAPKLANELCTNANDTNWTERLKHVGEAWDWARAKTWLRDFLNEDDLPSLEYALRETDEYINECLAELAAVRAWRFCFRKMQESHRRHLVGWQQAIRKIGKGTGKHAPKYRRMAQQQLNECKDAVPAWVMPLHRIYDTIRPSPGMFDVIIVDEASQCGPEALPLMYLSKHLLVVGDNKQISPDAVGIPLDQVFQLMSEYLYDFSHADSFNVNNSLFNHGELRFRNRIVLREHFRCMPEIIRFSNDLCYHSTPLIPLRQYPPQRLEPLNLVHIPTGYREGTQNKVINRPEAEAIVDKITECCSDQRYDDKTMGVIVLQGEAQASLIENMLLEQLGAEEMGKRRIICGNPYSFQGDERHIIFLSMVAAPNERIGAYTQARDERRFNVAASRAQDQIWLFHTATANDLSELCLRRRLIEHFQNPMSQITKALGDDAEQLRKLAFTANRQIQKPPHPFDSWFEVDVALEIAARGYRIVPQYPFAGKEIDLVIEGTKAQLAVECDGDHWHGPDQYEKDVERQRMLQRCGWRFQRIRECEFNANPDRALLPLWQHLDLLEISPLVSIPSPSVVGLDSDFLEMEAVPLDTSTKEPTYETEIPAPIFEESVIDSTGTLQDIHEQVSSPLQSGLNSYSNELSDDISGSEERIQLSFEETFDEVIEGYSTELLDDLYMWAKITNALDSEYMELLTCVTKYSDYHLSEQQRKSLHLMVEKAKELGFLAMES